MKLIRLKLGVSFRSLQAGFEFDFLKHGESYGGIEPYVLAGPNGSGKSNILEVLAAIFYHLETTPLRDPPESFRYDEESNPKGFRPETSIPDAFEIEFHHHKPHQDNLSSAFSITIPSHTRIQVTKEVGESYQSQIVSEDPKKKNKPLSNAELRQYLPDHILAYSSGENETLSLPFFKTRFLHLDEYFELLRKGFTQYPDAPESRLTFLDQEFSQAILLSNLLMQDENTLTALRDETKIGSLEQIKIILNRRLEVPRDEVDQFPTELLITETNEFEEETFFIPILHLLESKQGAEEDSQNSFLAPIEKLIRCASFHYHDPEAETLTLDYWVNRDTHDAFAQNFSSALELFQTFQTLLTLNLCTVSTQLKRDLYNSKSPYINETIPTLASDERIMRFKNVQITKQGSEDWLLTKDLSDGEHQHLHSLGLALLYRDQNCLFLLDEPETHFNPEWRSRFITSLKNCLRTSKHAQSEILITTHSPFLISDSKPNQVLVFSKKEEKVKIKRPEYNTFGASINKITMETFKQKKTIGGQAQQALAGFRQRFKNGEQDDAFITEIENTLGDSIEKILLIKTILDNRPPPKRKKGRKLDLD